jgi:hypothetical protein
MPISAVPLPRLISSLIWHVDTTIKPASPPLSPHLYFPTILSPGCSQTRPPSHRRGHRLSPLPVSPDFPHSLVCTGTFPSSSRTSLTFPCLFLCSKGPCSSSTGSYCPPADLRRAIAEPSDHPRLEDLATVIALDS